jgi:5-methylcytosine-specific restriction endonuclease McrA
MASNRPELGSKHWRTLRKLILERDNYQCWMCGNRANQVDHLIPPPVGTDAPENLAAACGPCNNRKNNRFNDTPVLTIDW